MKNDAVVKEEFDSQYTFWKLLTEYRIEIPIIQRDYAQGRDSAQSIRKELLESLYAALVNGDALDFDFVYGSSEECVEEDSKIKFLKLLPLDGQQRLTTLFLLHWYIAEKENRMEDARDILGHFSYTTRISSREFCEMIVGLDYSPIAEQAVSEFIKNENKYFKTWDTDPTIKAMLKMLDAIHKNFFESGPLFDKLISDSPALITFNYLPMEHYALTDDLYIKMNARGKALTVFENFKAKFIQHLKKNGLPSAHFEANIDGQWVELLWDYRSRNNTIDRPFMNLFCYFSEMIFSWFEEPHDCESPFHSNDIQGLVGYYDSEDKIDLFYKLMDLWESKKEAKDYLEGILSKERTTDKVRLFDGQPDIFSDIILGNAVSQFNKIILFSIMNRLIMLGKDTDNDKMLDYVRICRNLLIKNRFFAKDKCSFQQDFRFGRNGIPYTSFIANHLADSAEPYQEISPEKLDDYEGINSEIYHQESVKANIVLKTPELKRLINGLEDLTIFRSSIFNVLDYAVGYKDESLVEDLEKLFTRENSNEIIQALLSVGNYGIKATATLFGDRYFYGNKNRWYEVLTYSGDAGSNHKKILTDFIDQYEKNKSGCIADTLHKITTDNLKNIKLTDWRYCLVKYPATISDTEEVYNPDLVFAFEVNSAATILHRMNGKKLNAYHVIPEYIEASAQLGNKCSKYVAAQNSDDKGWVRLLDMPYGALGIELNESGEPYVRWYADENSDANSELGDKIKKQYETIDTKDFDRVEKIVTLANTAFEIVENI